MCGSNEACDKTSLCSTSSACGGAMREASQASAVDFYPKQRLVIFLYFFFVPSSPLADGASQRATTLPIPRVVTRDLPISPRFTPTSFCRNAGSALLHPRQRMAERFVLTSSRFPLGRSAHFFGLGRVKNVTMQVTS